MYRPLCPCPACSRHVLSTERACPFCGAVMPDDFRAHARPVAPRRLSRAAAFAFGTTLSLGACSSTTTTTDAGATDTARDAPAVDNGSTDASDAPGDEGSVFPLYGDPPPRDAGFDVVDDEGAPIAEYGGPPPVDAATDAVSDEGGAMFLYGAPPPPPVDAG